MTGWAIVAIPQDSDPVWKYSSETIPHMTLLFLGEQSLSDDETIHITDFVAHVASTMSPFMMSTERRGKLGLEDADVLFFNKDRHAKAIPDAARGFLLTDPGIQKAYNSTDQYPEWTPHLTLGYPTSPAKKDDREYPDFNWVQFDRVALWTGEFVGPTFRLKYPDTEEVDMVMNDKVDIFFEHFGVKGMHWGRSKNNGQPVSVSVTTTPGKKLFTKGGENQPAHADAKQAAAAKQIAKKSSTDALSTPELQNLVTRMNLESQYSKLTTAQVSPGRKYVNNMLSQIVKEQGTKIVKDQATKLVTEAVKQKAGV